MRTTDRHRPRTLLALILAGIVAAVLVPTPAPAETEAEQGGQLLQRIEAGTTTCGSLSTSDFDHIGEYVMERMVGSAAAHEAMNGRMRAMMGTRGETLAHVYMGRRFAGCATGRAPAAFGAMMGMMGAYGSSGMMGGGYRGNGGMMGSSSHGDGWSSGDTVAIVMIGLLLVVAAGALLAWHPWRRTGPTPLETLRDRFARGDIDKQEFDRVRKTLEGSA